MNRKGWGLTPGCRNSGDNNKRLGSITKAGSSMARWLLAQVAYQVLTTYALFKYLPKKSMTGSWLVPKTDGGATQVFCYAVDSQYAALCEMTVRATGQTESERVVGMVGIFPHKLQFLDWGILDLAKFDDAHHDKPIVVFGD